MTEWQPIETAPKDGTSIVLKGMFQCKVCAWVTEKDSRGKKHSFWWGWDWPQYEEPYLWMPLPEPPK